MENKMTYVKALEYVLTNCVIEDAEVREKLETLKTKQAEKKHGGTKKPTQVQLVNIGLKADILAHMKEGERYTITDLTKSVPTLEGLSSQKVNALVKALKDEHLVVRTEDKGRAYFALPVVEDEVGEE